ncbi:hypothetical protein OJF2_00230 [Aquisphaera giovannonii]|uniref:Uncharacterized protein n=1 Tax=Aquisphaera giovannonii TaxID=406548 RepID=A0A5B9VTG6_9BACT|nr:hypothetical protein [Aquisphaera giovannonii]QEH31558.1 hypothetical protein OJF2_00230 [Aquisphaera giovannonii]
MIPDLAKPKRPRRRDLEPARLTLRGVIWRSALLNLAVVLTSFPVLVAAGGRDTVVPLMLVLGGISLVIWAATFAVYGFATLVSVFRAPASSRKPRAAGVAASAGLADRWIDGPAA